MEFLDRVKVKRFVYRGNKKVKGLYSEKWGKGLLFEANKKPQSEFRIIGKTTRQEGYTEYGGYDEGTYFVPINYVTVYIVANGLGRRYQALAEDIELVDNK